jgi:hypothetical protein
VEAQYATERSERCGIDRGVLCSPLLPYLRAFEIPISSSHVAESAVQNCYVLSVNSKLKIVQAYQ